MFWREDEDQEKRYRVPDDVFDLVFKLHGKMLDIDHAYALSEALRQQLPADVCERIGVLGVRMAGSGNGWERPQEIDAEIPLSRRSRLIIRVHRDDSASVQAISDSRLQLGRHAIEIGASSARMLSHLGTLHARAVSCDAAQSEEEFLQQVAAQLRSMGIEVSKMICGKSGAIRTDEGSIFTRALMIADLQADESVRLQQHGIGDAHMLGCGLFVPHKGIDAVYERQE